MDTKSQLENALRDAMRNNDENRKRTIRLVIASIKNAEIDKGGQLDEAGIQAILQKEIKMRRESIEGAEKANRADLITETQNEVAILEEFMPKQLSDDELDTIVIEAIRQVNATSPADTGKVMKIIMPLVQGRAGGDRVSQTVRKHLIKG